MEKFLLFLDLCLHLNTARLILIVSGTSGVWVQRELLRLICFAARLAFRSAELPEVLRVQSCNTAFSQQQLATHPEKTLHTAQENLPRVWNPGHHVSIVSSYHE